jgi:hypothetical protein
MQETTTAIEQKKSAATKKKQVLKKLDPDSAKLLQALKDKINKKSYGRKIRDYEILSLSLGLVTQSHVLELQERTLSEKDRLGIAHESYQKTNGKITLDQFIGKLLKGEITMHSESNAKAQKEA